MLKDRLGIGKDGMEEVSEILSGEHDDVIDGGNGADEAKGCGRGRECGI